MEVISMESTVLGLLVITAVIALIVIGIFAVVTKLVVESMRNCNEIRYGLIGYYHSKKNVKATEFQIRLYLKKQAKEGGDDR